MQKLHIIGVGIAGIITTRLLLGKSANQAAHASQTRVSIIQIYNLALALHKDGNTDLYNKLMAMVRTYPNNYDANVIEQAKQAVTGKTQLIAAPTPIIKTTETRQDHTQPVVPTHIALPSMVNPAQYVQNQPRTYKQSAHVPYIWGDTVITWQVVDHGDEFDTTLLSVTGGFDPAQNGNIIILSGAKQENAQTPWVAGPNWEVIGSLPVVNQQLPFSKKGIFGHSNVYLALRVMQGGYWGTVLASGASSDQNYTQGLNVVLPAGVA